MKESVPNSISLHHYLKLEMLGSEAHIVFTADDITTDKRNAMTALALNTATRSATYIGAFIEDEQSNRNGKSG